MVIHDIIHSVLYNKCPRCHSGKVFENNFSYNPKNTFAMHHHCSECKLKYERETGFFYGAMYVSYALMSALLIIWFVTDLLLLHLDAFDLAMAVTSTMLVFFPVAYRWARLIWLNLFVRYDSGYAVKEPDIKKLNEIKLTEK